MNLKEKLARFVEFLEQDPGNLNLLSDIVRCYINLKDFEQAFRYVEQIKACNLHKGMLLQAEIYFNQSDYKQSYRAYNKVLNYEEDSLARYYLGLSCFKLQKIDEALVVLKPLIKKQDVNSLLLVARISYQKNQELDAIKYLDTVIALYPSNAEALAFKALIFIDQNKIDMAIPLAKKSLDYAPNLYEAQLVDALLSQDISINQLKKIENLLKIQAMDARLWFMHGFILFSNIKIKSAEISFNKAINIFPEYYDAFILLAYCQLLQNKNIQAMNTYKRARDILPKEADACAGIALINAINGDFKSAQKYYNESIKHDPDNFMGKLANIMIIKEYSPKNAREKFEILFKHDMQKYKNIFEDCLFGGSPSKLVH